MNVPIGYACGCGFRRRVTLKVLMGHTNKTDRLDAQELAVLLHNATLPLVIMASPIFDRRDGAWAGELSLEPEVEPEALAELEHLS